MAACNSNVKCTCSHTSCIRHGNCCQCVAHHRGKGEVPGCFFSEVGEKTNDRSIENFYQDYKNRSN